LTAAASPDESLGYVFCDEGGTAATMQALDPQTGELLGEPAPVCADRGVQPYSPRKTMLVHERYVAIACRKSEVDGSTIVQVFNRHDLTHVAPDWHSPDPLALSLRHLGDALIAKAEGEVVARVIAYVRKGGDILTVPASTLMLGRAGFTGRLVGVGESEDGRLVATISRNGRHGWLDVWQYTAALKVTGPQLTPQVARIARFALSTLRTRNVPYVEFADEGKMVHVRYGSEEDHNLSELGVFAIDPEFYKEKACAQLLDSPDGWWTDAQLLRAKAMAVCHAEAAP